MGNVLSTPTKCLMCKNEIQERVYIECTVCYKKIHVECEEDFRGTRGYCMCPHCENIGVLSINNSKHM